MRVAVLGHPQMPGQRQPVTGERDLPELHSVPSPGGSVHRPRTRARRRCGSVDGIGSALLTANVQSVGFEVDAGGNLTIDVLVRNLAYVKQVAIVYTTDNWVTFHNVSGGWKQSYPPFGLAHQVNAELWTVSASVGAGKHGQFAVFYDVNGSRFWDNNFGRNYSF